MTRVNIVIGEKDLTWILGRLAKELELHNGWTINQPGAAIDYCIPYLTYKDAKAPIKIGLFTHLEKSGEKRKRWMKCYGKFDANVCLSRSTALEYLKYTPKGTTFTPYHTIHLGTDVGKISVFGIVGKTYDSGRKNFEWVPELRKEVGIVYRSFGENKKEREEFYNKIDYLIITSSIEGGPVPVLDAIAMGVPVIAPDTGWCWEYPCIHYEKDNLESLKEVLTKLTKVRTWKDVAEDHKIYFESIYGV